MTNRRRSQRKFIPTTHSIYRLTTHRTKRTSVNRRRISNRIILRTFRHYFSVTHLNTTMANVNRRLNSRRARQKRIFSGRRVLTYTLKVSRRQLSCLRRQLDANQRRSHRFHTTPYSTTSIHVTTKLTNRAMGNQRPRPNTLTRQFNNRGQIRRLVSRTIFGTNTIITRNRHSVHTINRIQITIQMHNMHTSPSVTTLERHVTDISRRVRRHTFRLGQVSRNGHHFINRFRLRHGPFTGHTRRRFFRQARVFISIRQTHIRQLLADGHRRAVNRHNNTRHQVRHHLNMGLRLIRA